MVAKMKDALKSFALTTFAIILCLVLVWFYLKMKAAATPVPPAQPQAFMKDVSPEHPLIIAKGGGGGERPPNTLIAFDHAAALDPRLVFWADIRPTRDGVLVAYREQSLEAATNGRGWISFTDYSAITNLDAAYTWKDATGATPYRGQGARISTLKELLARYPDRRFVLNFRDYKPGLDDKIIAVIDEAKAGGRVLIQSEQNGLLKDLREKKPEWLFGTSYAQVTQLMLLLPLGLEAYAPIKGDVYVTSVERNGRELVSDAVIAEIHRRQMKILAGPVSADEALILQEKGVDGIITDDPSALMARLRK